MGASDQELTGRVAIVTGAGAGIGAGIAAMLAEAGAAVTVADLDGARAASTAKAIERRGGRAIMVTADVSDAHEIDALVRQTVTDLGGIDILVNNAGIATSTSDLATGAEDGAPQLEGHRRPLFRQSRSLR